MAKYDDPTRGEMADLLRRVRDLERASPLNNASIGRNGLRVHSGGVITIQNGGLSVTGTAEVIGKLIGSGTLTWTGPVSFEGTTNLDGPTKVVGRMDVTGPMFVSGDTDINGSLDITGNTRLYGDMAVQAAGKISVGNMRIGEGTHGSGKGVSFTNGGALSANGTSVEVYAATGGFLGVGTGSCSLSHNGSQVKVDGNGVSLSGPSLNTNLTPNIHMDGQGRLWRTS